MTALATGPFKTVAFKRQTGLGVVATGGAATGQYMRRVKSTLDLAKTTFKSNEVLVSQQRRDFRHGVRSITGTMSCELSVGAYQAYMESICRQVVQVAATSGALTTITAAVVSGATGTFTRSAGSWITDGYNVGDIVNSTGWATTGVPNNNHYSVIITLTATVMTVTFLDNVAMGAKAAGDSVTMIAVSKKITTVASGQVKHYYTVEHWFGDISQSELFSDVVIAEMQVKAPASGMATVDFPVMGLTYSETNTQYFTSPTAAATGGIEASPNGVLLVNSVVVGIVTAFEMTVKGNYSVPGGIVGSVNDPDVFPGVIDVTGQLTVLFADTTIVDLFVNETEFPVTLILTNSAGATTAAPNFTCFHMPRCKSGGATKDDGEKQITLTFPFTALEPTALQAGAIDDATLTIQDSAFA